jgi:hypothetical protein
MNMVETDMYGDQLPTPILTHAGNCIADHFALSVFQPVCRFGEQVTLKIFQARVWQ